MLLYYNYYKSYKNNYHYNYNNCYNNYYKNYHYNNYYYNNYYNYHYYYYSCYLPAVVRPVRGGEVLSVEISGALGDLLLEGLDVELALSLTILTRYYIFISNFKKLSTFIINKFNKLKRMVTATKLNQHSSNYNSPR
jgi:hypothetical protein